MGRLLRYTAILMATATILMLFPPVARASGARVDAMGGLYGFLDDEEEWFINPAFLGGVQEKVLDLTYGTGSVNSRKSISESNFGVEKLTDLQEKLIGFAEDPLNPGLLFQTTPQSLIFTTVLPFPEKNTAGNTFAIRYARYLSSYAGVMVDKDLSSPGTPTTTTSQTIEMPDSAITILDGWRASQRLALGFGYTLNPAQLAQTSRVEIRYPTGDVGTSEEVYEDSQPLNTYQAGLVYRFNQKSALDLAASYDRRSGEYTYRKTVANPLSDPLLGTNDSRVDSMDFSRGTGRIGFRHDLTENTSLILALTGQASTTVKNLGKATILDERNQVLELAIGFRTRTERWTLAGNAQVLGQAVEAVENGAIPQMDGSLRSYYNLGGEYRVGKALSFRAGAGLDVLRDPVDSSIIPSFRTTLGLGYMIDNFVLDLALPVLWADAEYDPADPLTGKPKFTSSVKYQAKFSISTRF